MASRSQWIAVGGIVAALLIALGLGLALSPDLFPVAVGSRAPEFTAVDVATGDTVGLAKYRGHVVLLNIWATWCVPCETEMPSMQRLHQDLGGQGLTIVAVSIDQASGEVVRTWAAQRGLTFKILHNQSGRIQSIYQTTGVPESFVIDRSGVIVKKVIGATVWDHPAQKALLRRLVVDTAETSRR